MIFVTIGSSQYAFDRLVIKMDEIAGNINEDIVIQTGETNYEPVNTKKHFKFISKEKMDILYKKSTVVVCHAGVGSIISALSYDKSVIVVPRRKKYGEAIDDHQLEIAKELELNNNIRVVYNLDNLEQSLRDSCETKSLSNFKSDNKLAFKLRNYLNELCNPFDRGTD